MAELLPQKYIEKGHKIHSDGGLSFGLAYHFWLLSTVHFDSADLKKAQKCIDEGLRISQKRITKNGLKDYQGFSWKDIGEEESILQGIKIEGHFFVIDISRQPTRGCPTVG